MVHGGRAGRLLESALHSVIAAGDQIVDLGAPQRFHKELRPYEDLFASTHYRAFGGGHEVIEASPLAGIEHRCAPFAAVSEKHAADRRVDSQAAARRLGER